MRIKRRVLRDWGNIRIDLWYAEGTKRHVEYLSQRELDSVRPETAEIYAPSAPKNFYQLLSILHELGHTQGFVPEHRTPEEQYLLERHAWDVALLAIKPEYHEKANILIRAALTTYDPHASAADKAKAAKLVVALDTFGEERQ